MISSINNIGQSIFQPFSQQQLPIIDTPSSPTSFDSEDKAIISAQAMLQNESEKFNSGGDNAVELALACVIAKTTVSAEVNVINTKKEIIDNILDMGK